MTITYTAFDGKVFKTSAECTSYENALIFNAYKDLEFYDSFGRRLTTCIEGLEECTYMFIKTPTAFNLLKNINIFADVEIPDNYGLWRYNEGWVSLSEELEEFFNWMPILEVVCNATNSVKKS